MCVIGFFDFSLSVDQSPVENRTHVPANTLDIDVLTSWVILFYRQETDENFLSIFNYLRWLILSRSVRSQQKIMMELLKLVEPMTATSRKKTIVAQFLRVWRWQKIGLDHFSFLIQRFTMHNWLLEQFLWVWQTRINDFIASDNVTMKASSMIWNARDVLSDKRPHY